MAMETTESPVKARRGDLVMVELKASYITSFYERQDATNCHPIG